MKANADMYSLGRQGVAYGFVGSTGFSCALCRANLSARLSSFETGGALSVGEEAEAEDGDDEDEEEESLERRVWSCVSRLLMVFSVVEVGWVPLRDIASRISRWKARRSCFRLAGRMLLLS